jgi:hypothetical protein
MAAADFQKLLGWSYVEEIERPVKARWDFFRHHGPLERDDFIWSRHRALFL